MFWQKNKVRREIETRRKKEAQRKNESEYDYIRRLIDDYGYFGVMCEFHLFSGCSDTCYHFPECFIRKVQDTQLEKLGLNSRGIIKTKP